MLWSIVITLDEAFFDIESLKLDKQFLCVVFGEYRNYCLLFFDITLNFLEKNMYANLLTRCDDNCVIRPYLFIYCNFLCFNLPQLWKVEAKEIEITNFKGTLTKY